MIGVLERWGEMPERRSFCNNGESRRDDISIDDREAKKHERRRCDISPANVSGRIG